MGVIGLAFGLIVRNTTPHNGTGQPILGLNGKGVQQNVMFPWDAVPPGECTDHWQEELKR